MANKILADLGLNPLNKFLLVYWFSLGFIVLDQITNISEITTTLAELGSVAAAIDMVAAALILYGAYLLYNKKKQGAIIAIATGIVSGIYWTFLAQTAGEFPIEFVAIYMVTFIVMVAGPVLLFPDEYS